MSYKHLDLDKRLSQSCVLAQREEGEMPAKWVDTKDVAPLTFNYNIDIPKLLTPMRVVQVDKDGPKMSLSSSLSSRGILGVQSSAPEQMDAGWAVGVTSWGKGCGRSWNNNKIKPSSRRGSPGVFTDVLMFLSWIKSNLRKGGYCGRVRASYLLSIS